MSQLKHTEGKEPNCKACQELTEQFHKNLTDCYNTNNTPRHMRVYPSVGRCDFLYQMWGVYEQR